MADYIHSNSCAEEMFPYPIVIQAFNRPDYLEKVLASLKNQTLQVDPANVWLFLDGCFSDCAQRMVADAKLVEKCRLTFERYFHSSNVFFMPINLGIARVRGLIESFVFGTLGSDWALIAEDDLELGPLYLAVILDLKNSFPIENRLASVGAYGEIGFSSRVNTSEDNDADAEQVIDLTYAWATLESKAYWLKRLAIAKVYETCFCLSDYRNRNISDLHGFFYELGFALKFSDSDNKSNTSQDNVKTMLNLVAGGFRINTKNNFARYIGAEGENYNRMLFEMEGFAQDSVLCQRKPSKYIFNSRELYIFKFLTYHYYYSILPSAAKCLELPSSGRLVYGQSSRISDVVSGAYSSNSGLNLSRFFSAFKSFRAQCALAAFELADVDGCIYYVYGQGTRLIECMRTIPIALDTFWLPEADFKSIVASNRIAPAIVFHVPTIWMNGIHSKRLINNLVFLLGNACRSLVVGSVQGWDPNLLCAASEDKIQLRDSLSPDQIKLEYPLSLSELAQVNPDIHQLLDLEGYGLVSIFRARLVG